MRTDYKENTQDLLQEAERYFGTGYVERLRTQGRDFLEHVPDGVFIHDSNGNAILDGDSSGGTFNLGRHRPELVRALNAASKVTDQGNFVMISAEKALLASRLAEFMPFNLTGMYFTVVRGEALDAAAKIARGHTGRAELLSLGGAWHGHTGFAMSLSQRQDKGLFGDLIPETGSIPLNDISAMERAITRKTAAVVVEPIQAENGCQQATPGFLRALRRKCDQSKTLLIMDETQTGFGRTGARFVCEQEDVAPDILLFGEAVAGGMFPMCGLAFTADVKSFFDAHPLIHMCTFGGHDMGCLVALEALDLYESYRPWDNCQARGEEILAGLEDEPDKHDFLESVEGKGLLLSLHFKSQETAEEFCRVSLSKGLYCKTGLVNKASVVLRPPLTITSEEGHAMVAVVNNTLNQMAG